MINDWQGVAFNQDPHSANEIHGDDLATRFGFEGGLVPGVTISAYLTHPGVEAWGMDFLARAKVHIKVLSPLYDGEAFTVAITGQTNSSYSARLLRRNGVVSATASVAIGEDLPQPPERRGDPMATDNYHGPAATPAVWKQLRDTGCQACRYTWTEQSLMRHYLRDAAAMPRLLRSEQPYANMSFVLGTSNWAAASNVTMNPWVHLETQSQNYKPIADGTSVITEMQVLGTFEKKGHRFFDALFGLFDDANDCCLADIKLRAIYQLRQ